jgi:hypothetical protein
LEEAYYKNMKRIILSAVVLLAFAACNQTKTNGTGEVNTTTSVSAEGAPAFKFEKEVYDFGKIKQGEKVSFDFIFTNTGNTPLIISDAVATCGCTVPEIPKEPVAAGAKSKINVVFSSAGKEGVQDKVVTITANTIPAQTKIHLIGEVIK